MESIRRTLAAALLVIALVTPAPAGAQYAEILRPLPVPVSRFFDHASFGGFTAATQIGRRLFLAGPFTRLAEPTGGAVVTTVLGTRVPGAFPFFDGTVSQILPDGTGGWLVVGDFRSVNGEPSSGFARVNADRTVDARFRVIADAAIMRLAIAHGRVYLAGAFTAINGVRRRGLAAFDAATGQLTSWGAGFDGRGAVRELAASSIAVYVSGGDGGGRLWGLEAGTGRVLFDRPGFVSAIAAASDRVYLGGGGYARPVWAVDPLTGTDLDWATDLTFQYLPVTYDLDGTRVTALLLDGDRLYIGGFFHTAEGHWSLAAVQAASGGAVGWRPSPPAPSFVVALVRVGPAIGASFIHWLGTGSWLYAFHSETAARLPFQPDVVGGVATVAPAPEGVVLGGSFAAGGGVDRGGLASIDLDTYALDPWTAAIAFWPARAAIAELATDGVWLFALTEGDLGGRDARIVKIDPATGAVAGERSFPSVVTRMRVAGSQLLVSTHKPYTNAGQLGAITIADFSFTALPVTIDGVVASLDATDDTVYFGGGFSTVNGEMRRGFAAVHRVTGAVQSWQPATNADGGIVRTAGGRVWLAGVFTRVGGQSRHGLAEVDPATGAPLPWNPDVGGVLSGGSTFGGVHRVEIASDGYLYAWLGPSLVSDTWARGVAAGQLTPLVLVYSTASGSRLPWRPAVTGLVALTPDCAVAPSGCLVEAVPSPANVQVSVVDHAVTITWTLPVTPARTGVRLEVGTVENRADLLALDLPAESSFVHCGRAAGALRGAGSGAGRPGHQSDDAGRVLRRWPARRARRPARSHGETRRRPCHLCLEPAQHRRAAAVRFGGGHRPRAARHRRSGGRWRSDQCDANPPGRHLLDSDRGRERSRSIGAERRGSGRPRATTVVPLVAAAQPGRDRVESRRDAHMGSPRGWIRSAATDRRRQRAGWQRHWHADSASIRHDLLDRGAAGYPLRAARGRLLRHREEQRSANRGAVKSSAPVRYGGQRDTTASFHTWVCHARHFTSAAIRPARAPSARKESNVSTCVRVQRFAAWIRARGTPAAAI